MTVGVLLAVVGTLMVVISVLDSMRLRARLRREFDAAIRALSTRHPEEGQGA